MTAKATRVPGMVWRGCAISRGPLSHRSTVRHHGIEVWLCVEPVDFRKQITGLATLVQDQLSMDPFSAQLFVFTNRRRTQCQVLYWERCGFVLFEQRAATIEQHEATIERLQEQVRLLLARCFGASSEKLPNGQLGLFDEAEVAADEEPEADAGTEVAAHRRARPVRAPLPESLERVDIEHELADSERTCPHHGVELERFAEVVSEQLDIVPAKVRVLRHVRGKYRCPSCEGHLRTAALPAQPLAKSFASPGLLAFIVTAKYVDGLPLYRQQQQFGRIGVELSRTTLARWVVGMGELVVPLMNLLHEELLVCRCARYFVSITGSSRDSATPVRPIRRSGACSA